MNKLCALMYFECIGRLKVRTVRRRTHRKCRGDPPVPAETRSGDTTYFIENFVIFYFLHKEIKTRWKLDQWCDKRDMYVDNVLY